MSGEPISNFQKVIKPSFTVNTIRKMRKCQHFFAKNVIYISTLSTYMGLYINKTAISKDEHSVKRGLCSELSINGCLFLIKKKPSQIKSEAGELY